MTITNWQAGSIVTLIFTTSLTVTHNAGGGTVNDASFFLESGLNFSANNNDTLTLIYDGSVWREISRVVI